MKGLPTIISLLLASTFSLAQDAPPSFKSTEVAPGIFVLEGDGGFVGGSMTMLVGDEYNVLIDDGISPLAPALLEAATDLAGGSIDFVINTHVHGDHVGGNAAFSENGAVVYAHENIRKRLLEDPADAGGPGGLPVITFSDQVTFHVNGLDAFVFHVEHAHTDGDAVIEFRGSNVIHAGDIFFNRLFPFIDLDSGGTVPGYIAGQQLILSLADDETKIIAGHGVLATKTDLQTAVDMLVDSQTRVSALIDAGNSLEQIQKANPLAEYHDVWNWGFITTARMTETLYRSLTDN